MFPNTDFFWSVFSCIRTKYGKIPGISPYSVRMRENTDQRKFRISTLFMQRKKSKTYILDMFEYPSECSGSVWYTINHGSHWYYRTNYVEGNWDAMLEQMNKNHTVLFYCHQLIQFQSTFTSQTAIKVNNGNTRTMFEICSQLTIKTPERRDCFHCWLWTSKYRLGYFNYIFKDINKTSIFLCWVSSATGIASKFRFQYKTKLSELTNIFPPDIIRKPWFCDDFKI